MGSRGRSRLMAMKFTGADRLKVKLGRISQRTVANVRRELQRGGLLIENDAAESIIKQTPGGRPYPSKGRKGAVHWASPPGSAPNADTGALHTSITSVTTQDSDAIRTQTGANTPYATALELGTSNMAPRPFMSPAFRKNTARITANIRSAVKRAQRSK